MKKRFAILLLCLSISVVATGCSKISPKETPVEATEDKTSETVEEVEAESETKIEANTEDDAKVSLKNVYVTGYTSDNGLFACDSDDFYQNLLLTTIDVELLSEENGNTLESLSEAWNAKIDTTVEALKNSPNLTIKVNSFGF